MNRPSGKVIIPPGIFSVKGVNSSILSESVLSPSTVLQKRNFSAFRQRADYPHSIGKRANERPRHSRRPHYEFEPKGQGGGSDMFLVFQASNSL